MMRLDDIRWKSFLIGDLFSVKRPTPRNKDDYMEGLIPFVASGSMNNGVLKWCVPRNDEKLDKAGCITVSPVDGSAFYQPYYFLGRGGAGSSILMLYSKHINKYNGQFIAKMISHTCSSKYNYGHMGNQNSIKREQIMLPVTDDGEPDFQFMEEYIRELMAAKKKQYRQIIEKRLAALNDVATETIDWSSAINERTWRPIVVSSEFSLIRGRENNMATLENGNIPLISAKSVNNGLKGFVDKPRAVIAGNCITLNNDGDGGAGLAYYQPSDMALDTHVTAFVPKEKINCYSMIFISECLSKLHGFFGHGLSISNKRAEKIRIMLPVTADGQPDYDFMEAFGRQMMAHKYRQYLNFLEKHNMDQ